MKKPGRQPKREVSSTRGKASTGKNTMQGAGLLRLQFCFFASGAAGLVYQVVWTKQLGLLFGYSAYAVATVLAVFMGGLAAGSAIFAWWRPVRRTGVALYAWMEFAIALSALLSLPGIPLVRQVYLATYPYLSGSAAGLLALRFVGAAIVLALPTILMGGTLPVLLSAVARSNSELGMRAGRFYAVNTAGAVAGTLAAGFVLIPWVGLRLTLLVAVALNLLAGAVAWKFAKQNDVARTNGVCLPQTTPTSSWRAPRWYLIGFALVGATAIAYELAWTRLLATPLGSSTYAFSLMLATFLLGIVFGSAVFEKWFRKTQRATSTLFAATQIGIAAAVLLSLWMYREIPELLLALLRAVGDDFSGLLLAQAAVCALVLLPVTILFGFNFPAVLALLSPGGAGGEIEWSGNVGRGVAANTFGAILAAILCGFYFLPRFGSFRLIAGAACLNVVLGMVLLLKASPVNWKPLSLAAALLAAIIWTAGSPAFFSKTSAAFGVVLYRGFHSSALTSREMADTEDVVFFKDGISATIAVARSENYVALKTNGKVDASNLDSGTQLLLGDLGAVFHPNPRRVLIIGFGGGMTASAVSRFPGVERIDCVEIEPAVLQAAAKLERLHRGVIRDPRLRIYFDDARNFLQTSGERYDLIISEPSNPWIAGIASLYTKEFFQIVRERLAPGGSFVQWIQAYGLSTDDFATILASLTPGFKDLTLWHSSGRDFLVLARNTNVPLSFDRARALWNHEPLRQDFAELKLAQPEGWLAYYRIGTSEIARLIAGAKVNTDDLNRIEYSAPQHLLRSALADELRQFVDGFSSGQVGAQFPREPLARMAAASAETALAVHSQAAAKLLSLIPTSDQAPDTAVLRARAKLAAGQAAEAASDLAGVQVGNTNHKLAQYWLAMALSAQGQLSSADSLLAEFLVAYPDNTQALEARVDLASRLQDWQIALSAQRNLLSLRPESAADQCRLGDLYLRSKQVQAAEGPLRKGLQLDPYAFLCHRDLGELNRARGRTGEAISDLEWVVRYFPEADAKTYISLALAYQATGERNKAARALEKGRRIFPQDKLLGEFALRP
jgi:predicted membrane-bound spermidine synthase/predicted Zn-dependent protease